MQETVAFKPRRGRPSAKQVAAIDAAILETAKQMFLSEGFDQVAMENIAFRTGVSKSTLYARYPSKEDLFSAVVKAAVSEWSSTAGAGDDQLPDDLGQRLRYHARTIAHSMTWKEVQAFRRVLLANQDRFPALSMAMYQQGYSFGLKVVMRDIEEAARRDQIPVADAKGIAERLNNAIVGWYMQESAVRDLPEAELLAFAERTADLLMAARASW